MNDAANPGGTPVVIAIAGLPGSGKSYYLESLKTEDPTLFVDSSNRAN